MKSYFTFKQPVKAIHKTTQEVFKKPTPTTSPNYV